MFWGYQAVAVDSLQGVIAFYTGRIDTRQLCHGSKQWSCREDAGPAGEVVVTRSGTGTEPNRRWVSVAVYRADGSYVSIDIDNSTERVEFGTGTGHYTGIQPPLTLEQITAIAFDPRITIYP